MAESSINSKLEILEKVLDSLETFSLPQKASGLSGTNTFSIREDNSVHK
jgi:hypothetical protein